MVRRGAVRHADVPTELLPHVALRPLVPPRQRLGAHGRHSRSGCGEPAAVRGANRVQLHSSRHALPRMAGAAHRLQAAHSLHHARAQTLYHRGPAHRGRHSGRARIRSAIHARDGFGTAGIPDSNVGGESAQPPRGGRRGALVLQRRAAHPALDARPDRHRRHGQFRQDIDQTLSLPHTLREIRRPHDPGQLQHHARRHTHGTRTSQAPPPSLHRRDGRQAERRYAIWYVPRSA